jgi:chitodextrinase
MSQLKRAATVTAVLVSVIVHVHVAAAAGNGLVAAYSFDQPGSAVFDASGTGNNGTVANATWTADGHDGGAYSFNGTSSMISVPDSSSLDLTTGMTLEAWVKPTVSDADWRCILMKEQAGMLVYSLYANAGSTAPRGELYLSGGTDVSANATGPLAPGAWTHLALTYDGTWEKLFVNGTQVKKVNASGALTVANGALRIGGDAIWGEYFNGLIDNVRIYNRALTATQIQSDKSTPVTGSGGLVAAYSLDQSGSTVADASGNGNAGTVSGATWTAGGRYGGAYSFNGTSSYIDVPDSPSLDLTTGMTLEAWVDPAAASSWRNVLMKEQPGMLVYSLYANGVTAAPHAEVYLAAGADAAADGPTAVPTGTWTHLAETYDGSLLSLYVNGQLAASTPASGSLLTSTGDLRIGGDSVWGEWFSGLIDEVRIYNRALSPAEIQSDMSTGIGAPLSGDTTPPSAPTGVTATASTQTSVSLAWSASSDNVGVSGYGVYKNGASAGSTSTTSYTVSGLACGSTYTLAVDAYDAAGNRSAKTTISAATAACPAGDTTPPSTPSGVTATASTQTSVSLTWNASTDNVGVTGYGVYSNGVSAGSTSTTSYTVSGLACGTSYALAVDAYDAAGNRSAQAATTASTQACSTGAQVFVAPGGSDSNPCTASAPCLSWNHAYQVAAPGQVVQIAAGTYAGQTIAVDSSMSSATQDITFVTAPGATVTLTGDLQILGSHVHIVGPIATDQHHKLLIDSIPSPQRTHNVTVENFSGEDFVIGPASYVTVKGGSFGPSVGCQDTGEYENKISASNNLPGVAPDHITIDGVTIHDQTTVNSVSCHNGGLNIVGSTFLTIENSKWYKAMVYDIEFDDFTGSFPLHDIVIQNNWFDAPTGALDNVGGCSTGVNCAGEADVQVKWNGVAAQSWLVRFNSFANGFAPEWDGPPPSYSNFRVVGNAGGNAWNGSAWMACAPAGKSGVTIAYNAWAGLDNLGSAPASATCSSTDVSLGPVTNYATTYLPYVNPSVTAPDFHLKSGTKAENLVTPTTADYSLATDIDGQTRSVPRDAGSDDH